MDYNPVDQPIDQQQQPDPAKTAAETSSQAATFEEQEKAAQHEEITQDKALGEVRGPAELADLAAGRILSAIKFINDIPKDSEYIAISQHVKDLQRIAGTIAAKSANIARSNG